MKRAGIVVEGGIGKHIAFSSLIPKLHEKYGELILISAYPEVFMNNPHVYRNFGFGAPYVYEDYLKDIPIIKQEPYLSNVYRLEKKHIIESFCKLYDIEYSEKDMHNEIYLTEQEDKHCENTTKQSIKSKFILVQFVGGTSYYNPAMAGQKAYTSRDYPMDMAQQFVDEFYKKYPDYKILQVRLPTEPLLKNVNFITNVPARNIFPYMKYCETFVVIDSFLNHVSDVYSKKGIVLWGATDPKKLGYKNNLNLCAGKKCSTPFCHRPETYFFDTVTGGVWKCPYNNMCMNISVNTILSAVDFILKPENRTKIAVDVNTQKKEETNTDEKCSLYRPASQ